MTLSKLFSDYAIYLNRERKADSRTEKQLIERLTATASEILCRAKRFAYSHIPEQFFTVTIKELPDENFGIGGKSIDEIKRNYKP